MTNKAKILVTLTALILCFGLGYLLANIYNNFVTNDIHQKPVVDLKEKEEIVSEDTQIVYEQEYLRCKHTIISEFNDREILEGKNLDQIRKIFSNNNGYSIEYIGKTLVIHQIIDDWCPADKNKYRLKDYKGRVAVYKGPDRNNDTLEKVTNIYMSSLPVDLQDKIRKGEWEFKDINAINDALENLDEYL